MRYLGRISATLSALAFVVGAFADEPTLAPGTPAPKLDVTQWLKGTPVKELDPKQTYVVEFWATWCGPCIQSIPHLTELAHKYKGKVTFVGVSIWETPENCPGFVKDMGAKMDYNVGYSGNQDRMAKSWMAAAGQNGIPTAFVVKGGQIQWIGHPMTLGEPLAKIVAGKYDLNAAKTVYAKQMEGRKAEMKLQAEIEAAEKLHDAGKLDDASAALDTIEKANPRMKAQFESIRFNWTAVDAPTKARALIDERIYKGSQSDLQFLCMFALRQAQPNAKAAELGEYAISQAFTKTPKDFIVCYYAANFYQQKKDAKKTVEAVDAAIAAIAGSPYKDNKQLAEALTKMKATAQAGFPATGH